MIAIEAGSEKLCKALQIHADLINLPRVGCAHNYAVPNQQLNISPCELADKLACMSTLSTCRVYHC